MQQQSADLPQNNQFETWSAPGHSFRIEYSAAVLDQIREIAVEGYHRVPHGGVETGGVLFGTHGKKMARIAAWRPIECEYAKGPSFQLSEKDEAALAAMLQSFGDVKDLAGLEPVGWYRAHTRSEILLADVDLTFFNRFFPQPWQVGLIVRPASFAPARAGFFFREPGGGIRTESSYREFVMLPLPQSAAIPIPEAAKAPEVREVPKALEIPPVAVVPERPASPQKNARRNQYAATALLLIAAAFLGYWLMKPSRQGLALSATDTGGELRIAWDRTSSPITHATGGSLDIDDHGLRTQVKLTQADLRSGSVFYARQSGDVAVRMSVDLPGNAPLEEMTRFLRPVARTARPAKEPVEQASRAVEQPTPPRPAPTVARHIIPFRAPAAAAKQTSAAIPAIAPPKIDNLSQPPQSNALNSVLGTPALPSAPAPSRPKSPTPAAVVSSGRIIWTGKLSKNGRLVVEANRPSTGALSGALPAAAVHVSAYPGDLTGAGMTLFTADRRYAKPLTEAAGAANGWLPTTYTLDPKRAAAIKVLEQPNPRNGYKLVLESDTAKLSVVVLEWRAVE